MSLLDKLRKVLAGPPRVQATGDEEAAALQEEFGAPDEGAAEVEHMAETGGGGGMIRGDRYAAREAADAAESDLGSEEAPADPEP